MIRRLVDRYFNEDDKYSEMFGLSSDTKPEDGLITGSKYIEVDTGIEYRFDEESRSWTPQNSGNGKTSIKGATVTLGSDLTYDGTQKTKSVSSVKIGSTTLTENTDYIVKDNQAVEPGSYTLHIIGIGSYTGVLAEAWTIGKASGSVTASPDTLSLNPEGDDGTSTLSVTGDGGITVESSDEDVATAEVSGTTVTVHPMAVGSATITVTMAATARYTTASDTIAVTVAEAEENGGEG